MATMPVITKKKRSRIPVKRGPSGGWVCLRSMMPCTFQPPAQSAGFAVYFDDNKIPGFAANALGKITIRPAPLKQTSTNGCGGSPDLNRYIDDYIDGQAVLSGTFCTTAKLVRIIY